MLLPALVLAIALPLALALLVLALPPRRAGLVALAGPAGIAAAGWLLGGGLADGSGPVVLASWVPAAGLDVRLLVDRLGVFFLLVIGLVGLAIFQYARAYFGPGAPRSFWALMLLFAAAMSGLVLSDSLILFYLCWEATTVASALLIGGEGRSREARRGAIQAFLVTGFGGLCLLAGIVLLERLGGTYEFSQLIGRREALLADPRHHLALALMLVGALAKSAQFPFHFWLPGAMAASTPVSAYLHSATMVQAGLVLVARLLPAFGTSPMWLPLLATVGLTTFVVSGWAALRSFDLKRLLAHSTAAYLGMITAYYGFVGKEGRHDDLMLIANHALYKAALFLLVGWIEKVTGTRDLRTLTPERWILHVPVGAVLFGVGVLAMAGAPLLLGFASKELFLAALLEDEAATFRWAELGAAVLGSGLALGGALKFGNVFFGPRPPPLERGKPLREVSAWLLVVPGALLVFQVLGGIAPRPLAAALQPGTQVPEGLAIWHHVDQLLGLSLGGYAVGLLLFAAWQAIARTRRAPAADFLARAFTHRFLLLSSALGRAMLAGGHPRYVALTVAAGLGLAYALAPGAAAPGWPGPLAGEDAALAWVPALLVFAGTGGALFLADRASKAIALGMAGFGVALFYALFRAPDLVLTQVLVESLTLVLVLLAFARLPPLGADRRSGLRKAAHAVLAGAVGLGMAALGLAAAGVPVEDPAGARQFALAWPEARGMNAVNVILVDFRGADTLGELVVLAIAALGGLVLLEKADGAPAPGAPDSRILAKAARGVLPGALVFAVYLLARGHDAPGGGFIAGLVIALAFILEAIAMGRASVRRRLHGRPLLAIAGGLAVAALAAGASLAAGAPFFTHLWTDGKVPGGPTLSTTLLFDVGVLLVVVATTSAFASALRRGES